MWKWLSKTIAFFVLAVASVGAVWLSWPVPEVLQPTAFPHAKHVALRMICVSCHTGAFQEARAGIPSTQVCALCHKVDRTFPPTSQQLAAFIRSGQEIPWKPVEQLPRHVYFSHRRHVKVAGLNCANCHGNVGAKVEPVTQSHFSKGEAGMMQCVDCHRRERVTTDCLGCHH